MARRSAMAPSSNAVIPDGMEVEEAEAEAEEEHSHAGYVQLGLHHENGIAAAEFVAVNSNENLGTNGNGTLSVNGNGTLAGNGTETPVVNGNGSLAVEFNGMQIHVYGDVRGLERLLAQSNGTEHNGLPEIDEEEEEEEEQQRRVSEERIKAAEDMDIARRTAPLSPRRCETIRGVMQNFNLGFRPEWAEKVQEDEWIARLRNSTPSNRMCNVGGEFPKGVRPRAHRFSFPSLNPGWGDGIASDVNLVFHDTNTPRCVPKRKNASTTHRSHPSHGNAALPSVVLQRSAT